MEDFEKIPIGQGEAVDSEKEREFELKEAQLTELLRDPVLRIVALDIIARENIKDEANEKEKRALEIENARDIVLKTFGNELSFDRAIWKSGEKSLPGEWLGIYRDEPDSKFNPTDPYSGHMTNVNVLGLNGQALYNKLVEVFGRDPNKEAQE
jgi:hypothetical protein